MDNDKQAQFLPFHAINEFMRDDYRLEVVRTTLQALPNLDQSFSAPIERLTKKSVTVPGFRNSAKAPAAMRIRPTAEAFQKNAALAAAILSAWAESHADLRQQVNDLLIARQWEILPLEADRTRLPGFLTKWPKNEDFDALSEVFASQYPASTASKDDISLMIVWLSTRLPYQFGPEDEGDEDDLQTDDQAASK